ncbi:lipopolysaccharide biosynthesis protein [Azospirillum doebereinerae]|uniref:Lipopolysaccharide biosynthesis protein n=1 Tax=Azospirillum doebereinerae TaxID=92933 RepID=A0A3S0V2U1_9PROT|nr:oligosaccharide flippase family protein [Azospirillum doebereinerae]MCG5241471.1 oligosaccharide flippase family protein [Azospirillum doebereinerae]RUQ74451.1 lipopolysaccharide biosynthesis protein [Azospirillum doebereinerae]
MASEAGNIIKHGWLFMVANVVNRAAGLLLLPLYTKVLTPPEFGVYALVVVVSDLLAVMLMIGMSNAFTAVYFEHEEGPERRRVVSTCLLALFGVSVAMIGLSYPAGLAGSWAMFGSGEHATVMALALFGVALTTLFELALAYYRVRRRSGLCLAVSLGKVVALLGFNVVFLWAMKLGVEGIFLANAGSFAVLGLGLMAVILRENGVGFSWPVLKRVGTLGLPYMPQSLLDIANNFVARWLLNVLLTTAAVGIFAFGMRLAQILYMFLTASFLQIWSVSRLESGRETDSAQADFVFHLFVTVLTTAALGMALVSPEILWLIASDAYAPVLPCMPFLVLAFVLHGVRMNPEVAILKARRVGVLPWISAASLAVGTGLAVVMVWRWGVLGAALANLGREVFQIVVTETVRRRLCRDDVPLNAVRVGWIVAPAMAAYAAGAYLFGDAVDPAVTAQKVLLTLAFLGVTLFGPGIGPVGRGVMMKMLPRLQRRAASTP